MKKDIKLHEDDYYYNIVSNNIRRYRKFNDITQEELAEMIGLSTNYISLIESGKEKINFKLSVVGRIADALNIKITDLFNEDIQVKKKIKKEKK